MNFLELTKKRYSARSYTSDVIEQEKLDYILECARFAPSAVNYQPWHFIVVKSDENRAKLNECYPRQWFATAPLYIVICTDIDVAWKRQSDSKSHADIDAAIAIEHICLAAAEQGIGSCWVCNFDLEIFKSNFSLLPSQYPVAIVTMGYVEKSPDGTSKRKELSEIVSTI